MGNITNKVIFNKKIQSAGIKENGTKTQDGLGH